MKTEPIKVSAALEKAATMKDGGVRLTFDTQELDAKRAGELFALKKTVGWLIFATYGNEQVVIPDAPPPEFKGQKTPSQRLHSITFVEWKQRGSNGNFDSYYKARIEGFINEIKDGLEPEA